METKRLNIAIEDTQKVAELAKLLFSEHELVQLNGEMRVILEHVSSLQNVSTEGLEATLSVGVHSNIFREDVEQQSMSREDALMNAPAQRNGCFEIVRILPKATERVEK